MYIYIYININTHDLRAADSVIEYIPFKGGEKFGDFVDGAALKDLPKLVEGLKKLFLEVSLKVCEKHVESLLL